MYKKELVLKLFRIEVGTISNKTAGMLLSRSMQAPYKTEPGSTRIPLLRQCMVRSLVSVCHVLAKCEAWLVSTAIVKSLVSSIFAVQDKSAKAMQPNYFTLYH